MNRSTNLFYTNKEDSKFITFSNYTESLTGNFLSTDTKLFPSKFICMYIDELDNDTKPIFIKYISAYYENKLAFLRDHLQNEGKLTGDYLKPLNYLLEAIMRLKGFKSYIQIDKDAQSSLLNIYRYNRIYYYNTSCPFDTEGYNLINYDTSTGSFDWDNYAKYYNDDGTFNIYNEDGFWSNATDFYSEVVRQAEAGLIDYQWLNISGDDTLINELYNNVIADKNNLFIYENVTNVKDLTLASFDELNEILNDTDLQCNYISFVGDVTEQDYNGKYADTICVIDSSEFPRGLLTSKLSSTDTFNYEDFSPVEYINSEDYTISSDYLYGWYDVKTNKATNEKSWFSKCPGYYYDVTPVTDDNNTTEEVESEDSEGNIVTGTVDTGGRYYIDSLIDSIDLTTTKFGNYMSSIKFNIVIPLFDVVDTNYATNTDLVSELDEIYLNDQSTLELKNIPMGIWFSGQDPVDLKRDDISGYMPSWSLVIANQFKPFPNSLHMPNESEVDVKKDAYVTFAQVLTKQNTILDKLSTITTNMQNISDRLTTLESKVNTVGSDYYLDDMHKEIVEFENQYNDDMDSFKTEIYSYITSNTWTWRE